MHFIHFYLGPHFEVEHFPHCSMVSIQFKKSQEKCILGITSNPRLFRTPTYYISEIFNHPLLIPTPPIIRDLRVLIQRLALTLRPYRRLPKISSELILGQRHFFA